MSMTLNLNPDFLPLLIDCVDEPEQKVFIGIAASGLASCPWILDLESLSECIDVPVETLNLILDKWADIGLISISRDEGDSMLEQSIRLNVLGRLAEEKSCARNFISEMNTENQSQKGSSDVPMVQD